MITFQKAFISNGKCFQTLKEAQQSEIKDILTPSLNGVATDDTASYVAGVLVEQKDKIVSVLSMGPGSRPRARAINGGRKVRKKAEVDGKPAKLTIVKDEEPTTS
jgi:hypothetical protein